MQKQIKPPIDLLEYEELKEQLLRDPEMQNIKPSRVSTFIKLIFLIMLMATCGVMPYVVYTNTVNMCHDAMVEVILGA